MVEQGLVMLIQNTLNDPTILGGFPYVPKGAKDLIRPINPKAWSYRCILSEPIYVLEGQDLLTALEMQIDCYGYSMPDAMTVAKAIDSVLRGSWSGTLPDPDATVVTGIFRLPSFVDGYSDINSSYVRSLEYSIHYYQA